jgi:hypothetical protein
MEKHHVVMNLTPETKRGAEWLEMNNWLTELLLDHTYESTIVGSRGLDILTFFFAAHPFPSQSLRDVF